MTTRTNLIALLLVTSASTTMSGTGVPSGGGGFLLGGVAKHATDPENSANDVIKIDTSSDCPLLAPCGFGTVSRKLNVKITALDNQLEFKSYFTRVMCVVPEDPSEDPEFAPRLTRGTTLLPLPEPELPPDRSSIGLPRIQLAIDLDGDGKADKNAFGHLSPASCPPERWNYDDVTDDQPRWDLLQLAAAFAGACDAGGVADICQSLPSIGTLRWDEFATALTLLFPNHKVCSGALVDDSVGIPVATGVAYYDLISLGRATWHVYANTAGRGFARGCGEVDHPDDDHDGDCDRDHDVDDDDVEFDHKRRELLGN